MNKLYERYKNELKKKGKRLGDIVVSGPALIVSAPIQLLTAAAVYSSMGKPVLFKQERPGVNGISFKLMKFRSMHEVDESKGLTDDASRLTRVGKIIRSTSLDELPALINIIKGEMSLVGPRPLRVKYLDRYNSEQARRHLVKPGLTGLAQVSGRNGISWEERFALDTYYVDHMSPWLDLKIIAKTVQVVLSREGVSEEGKATMTEFLGSSEEQLSEVRIEPNSLLSGALTDIRRLVARVLGGSALEEGAREVEDALRATESVPSADSARSIISYAKKHVPFYQRLDGNSLEELPVVDKHLIRSNYDDHLSDEFVSSKLSSSSTSGSTGVPFKVFFDGSKVRRHRAGLVGSYRFIGLDPYAPLVHSKSWMRATPKVRAVQAVKEHFANSKVSYDDDSVKEIVNWIQSRRGVGLMGYTSMTESLLHELENRGVEFPKGTISAVIGGSEPATAYLTNASERLFGVSARMRYSNMEMGIIGVTGDDINTYHVDSSSFYVEILEEHGDRPVEPGKLGRIVITDLYNKAMPLLRYDTGDLGRHPISDEGKELKNQLTDLRGRRLDILLGGTEAAPERLHPLVIWGPLAQIEELNQFQLRQTAIGKFEWVLNSQENIELEKRLRAILEERVGNILECTFTYVDEVPILASGKRQFFVSDIDDPASYVTGSI